MKYVKPNSGIEKFAITLKSFDIEVQPFIEEIDAKEGVIRECTDATTMERIRSMPFVYVFDTNLIHNCLDIGVFLIKDITSELKPLNSRH